jgi:metal-dependent amidase/aminoacylase/carboxypeptidase family protein
MPPAYNDPQLTAQATELMAAALGADNVVDAFIPDMGCEEFSLFQEQIPGLFLFIGKDRVGEDIVPIHAPNYIFNDEILTVGVKALCAIAMGYRKY